MAAIDNTGYYTALGVEKTASGGEIKRAYFLLARQYHPDKNPNNPEAEQKVRIEWSPSRGGGTALTLCGWSLVSLCFSSKTARFDH